MLMETYYVKQHVFSWKDRFTVKNSSGQDVYFVEGEFLSFGKKLRIYNPDGREVLYIEQQIWNFLPSYTLFVQGEEVATVRKELSFFRPSYKIEGPGWQVRGSVWQHHYQMLEEGSVVAEVEKEWFSWGDSYALTVSEEEASILALGIMIVIDCVMESESSAN